MSGRLSGRGLLLAGAVAIVVIVVGVAISVLDSPAGERRRRLDERRLEDLHAIADAIDAYWTREGGLPPDLDTLAGWEGLDTPRTDPVSAVPYPYRVKGDRTYELCATFATDAPGREPRRSWRRHATFWHHPAGDHCFELEAERLER